MSCLLFLCFPREWSTKQNDNEAWLEVRQVKGERSDKQRHIVSSTVGLGIMAIIITPQKKTFSNSNHKNTLYSEWTGLCSYCLIVPGWFQHGTKNINYLECIKIIYGGQIMNKHVDVIPVTTVHLVSWKFGRQLKNLPTFVLTSFQAWIAFLHTPTSWRPLGFHLLVLSPMLLSSECLL